MWKVKAKLVKPQPSNTPDLDPEVLTKTLSHAKKGEIAAINSSDDYIYQRNGKSNSSGQQLRIY